jgi:hypothetical protein
MKTRPVPRHAVRAVRAAGCSRAVLDELLLGSGSPTLACRARRSEARHRAASTGVDRGAVLLAGQCAELAALHRAAPDLFSRPDVAAALRAAIDLLTGV